MSGGVFVSPYNPTQQSGVRAKNPPDLVIAARAPTVKDFGFFPGTLWLFVGNSYWGMLNNYLAGVPTGVWALMTAAGGVLNTINGVAPSLGNINLVANQTNPGIPDAIVITAPSTQGPANTVGIGVLVDNVTIQIDPATGQLQAIAVSPALTLQGSAPSLPQPYLANNFVFDSAASGAINFNSSGPGVMAVAVQVDNSTIVVNGSNQLQTQGSIVSTTATAAGASGVCGTIPLALNTAYHIIAYVISYNSATPRTCGGMAQCIAYRAGGGAVLLPMQNQTYFDETPASPPANNDFNFSAVGNNIQLNVLGDAGVGLNWKSRIVFTEIAHP